MCLPKCVKTVILDMATNTPLHLIEVSNAHFRVFTCDDRNSLIFLFKSFKICRILRNYGSLRSPLFHVCIQIQYSNQLNQTDYELCLMPLSSPPHLTKMYFFQHRVYNFYFCCSIDKQTSCWQVHTNGAQKMKLVHIHCFHLK